MSVINKLIEKGIDFGVGFIPGGQFIQSSIKYLAQSLLGRDDATECEISQAIQDATPAQLADIQSMTLKLQQEEEKTKQLDIRQSGKQLDFMQLLISKLSDKNSKIGRYILLYLLFMYSILIAGMYYCHMDTIFSDDMVRFFRHSIFTIMVITPIMPIALVFKPIYNIVDAISQSIQAIAFVPAKTINGISGFASRFMK